VIGAFAYPGNCLNLTDYGVMNELALAYEATLGISAAAGTPLPVNSLREKASAYFIRAQAFVTERMCRSPSATRR
jgi:hypothetical protein